MSQSIRKTEVGLSQLPTYTAGPLSVGLAKPFVEADPSGRTCPIERRDLTSRHALLHRITMEYDEMPGLRTWFSVPGIFFRAWNCGTRTRQDAAE